jgi:streptogramin lyase
MTVRALTLPVRKMMPRVYMSYTATHARTRGLVGIATGPDGNIWFTSTTTNRIGYLRPSDAPTTQTAEVRAPH